MKELNQTFAVTAIVLSLANFGFFAAGSALDSFLLSSGLRC